MGCAVCNSRIANSAKPTVKQVYSEPVGCDYTVPMMQEWRTKLLCVRHNNLYGEVDITIAKLNSALGIVVSAINTGGNTCYFAKYLDDIAPIIMRIINTNKC